MKISNPKQIQIEEYNYNLPDHKIAKYPLVKRDTSKLLIYQNSKIKDSTFDCLSQYIPENTLMIFNNTKVIQARMIFKKATGAQIEIFCLEPYVPNDYALIFQQKSCCSWLCMVGNLKKWKDGVLLKEIYIGTVKVTMEAAKLQSLNDSHIVEFRWNNPDFSFADLLEAGGELPIPPYLNRKTEETDKNTYQTTYSKIKGSVAAPTAGLHFTSKTFEDLQNKGVVTQEVTLHVGAGTFKPVKSKTLEEHIMHTEFISVSKETIEHLINHSGKIIAVGTTSVRTLESLYYIGLLLEKDEQSTLSVSQWQPYDLDQESISKRHALETILNYLEKNKISHLLADTQIMIVPGYEFKIVDGIITNFHQPQSTLLLLVSAFVDGNWKNIYDHALSTEYRFLSYGDSSLLMRK